MATKRATPQKSGGRRKKRRSGTWTVIWVAVATLIAGLIIISLLPTAKRDLESKRTAPAEPPAAPRQESEEKAAKPQQPPVAAQPNRMDALVYSVAADGEHLAPRRVSVRATTAADGIRDALTALFTEKPGPDGPTVPKGTRLIGVKIEGGVAYVDLSGDVIDKFTGGATDELVTVYAIVDTVALNFKGVERVQILVDGKKEATLAGHVDISRPLVPNRGVILKGAGRG